MTADQPTPSLLGCPFCGSPVELRWDRRHVGPDICFVRCGFVGCAINPDGGEHTVEAEAIAAWNRRATDDETSKLRERVRELEAALNTPELHDFAAGVVSEAQHQRSRWGSDHDAGKADADWFWLVGYLAGKALTAANAGNHDKALHHCISTAAALANWHAAIAGLHNSMRPGIDGERALSPKAAPPKENDHG